MTLILATYLGGILTILSPCILPILPFVFARASKPFITNTLPMMAGMALMFALVATVAAIGGGWVVQANEYGRIASLILLTVFGVSLLFPSLSDHLSRPIVGIGNRLSASATEGRRGELTGAVLLGISLGFLWAPCAGPILGLVLTGAALHGASAQTSFLLFSYAAGAATSLAVALLAGGKVFTALKRTIPIGEWVRRALGVVVIACVAFIALNLDQKFLTKYSAFNTNRIEQALLQDFGVNDARGYGKRSRRRWQFSFARRRDRLAEFSIDYLTGVARQGGTGRFLDLFLHQLHPFLAVYRGVGAEIS